MPNKNNNLHKAKDAKNDEFYTQLTDVSKEMVHYKNHFKDKIVLCNCDDPTWSAFWKYFHLNFEELGLKKLISTHYDQENSTYKTEYEGGNDNDIEVGIKTYLEGNGDFRNQECIELLKKSDIVVTNPPFSLFREYVAQLVKYKKSFLIIGNQNAITYKEIFPLIRNDEMWIGVNNGDMAFKVPSYYEERATRYWQDTTGQKWRSMGNICWFTNLDVAYRHEKLILWKTYNENEYPKYDNYDAINVDKVANIPIDYNGVMGVPITFLNKYNPEQFEIVSFRKDENGNVLAFSRGGEREFNCSFISLYDFNSRDDKKCRRENQWKTYLCKNNNQTKIESIDYFFPSSMSINGCMNSPKDTMVNGVKKYARILVKRKENL